MSGNNRPNKRMIRIGATAMIVAIAAIAASHLIGPATDPRATSSVSAAAQGGPENLAAPANPSDGSKP